VGRTNLAHDSTLVRSSSELINFGFKCGHRLTTVAEQLLVSQPPNQISPPHQSYVGDSISKLQIQVAT
jgi:hypothetical protein